MTNNQDAKTVYPEVYLTTRGDDASLCLVNPLSGRKYVVFAVDGNEGTIEELAQDFSALTIHVNKGNAVFRNLFGQFMVKEDFVYEKPNQ